MQPQPAPATNTYEPKWRHFHPLSRIWVQNPFEHDVVFQVADEYNRPFRYRLPAGKVSELPGGAIATLGVKAIVDELIQNSKPDEMRMWDKTVRAKYEAQIIMREKESTAQVGSVNPGEIDLGVKSDVDSEPENEPVAVGGIDAFAGLNEPTLDPLPQADNPEVDNIVNASLPKTDAVIGANNADSSVEG